jgi:non-heme Fe2+,alpha-ketoglutarate-dependent halogenase
LNTIGRRLTTLERDQYVDRGYVKNLPVFECAEVKALQDHFETTLTRLPEDLDVNLVNNWHKANRWVYDLCRTSAILDYVEDLIGPDFFQWGGQFFCKLPGMTSKVPWHQDAHYWPLTPHDTVTVWLAFYDSDDENGAMRVVAGSHEAGLFEHNTVDKAENVLNQSIDEDQFLPEDIVTIDLKAGEMSLHDDRLIHGSGPSLSGRRRVGLTMRFCPTKVKCDLSVWPTFEAYQVRGTDEYKHNPVGKVPVGEGYPVRRFQQSSEFV